MAKDGTNRAVQDRVQADQERHSLRRLLREKRRKL